MTSTLFLDPSYNSSKFRSEFRFPKANGVYKADMRLLNIGVHKTTAGDTSYNILTGAQGVIDSLQIYSGSQLIDQVQHFSQYVAIKNLLHSNNANQSVHRPLSKNKLGYVSVGKDAIAVGGVVSLGIQQSNAVPDRFNTIYGSTATAAQLATNGSWIDLRECLGFLKASAYIPMNVFPDLRIIVNYKNADLIDIVRSRAAPLATIEPLLVCEYEPNVETAAALMRNYKGVDFQTVEWEQVQLGAVAVGDDLTVEQTESYLVKGFNDKYISKVVIVNTATDSSTWNVAGNNNAMGNQGSMSQLDFGFQARINGSNMFPKTQVEGKNRRLGMMADAFGPMNIIYGQNICWTTNVGAITIAALNSTVGQVDYTGFKIDDVIKEFKLDVSRTAVGPTAAGAATDNTLLRQKLNLNMFGLSRKRVVPLSNGSILIQYV